MQHVGAFCAARGVGYLSLQRELLALQLHALDLYLEVIDLAIHESHQYESTFTAIGSGADAGDFTLSAREQPPQTTPEGLGALRVGRRVAPL